MVESKASSARGQPSVPHGAWGRNTIAEYSPKSSEKCFWLWGCELGPRVSYLIRHHWGEGVIHGKVLKRQGTLLSGGTDAGFGSISVISEYERYLGSKKVCGVNLRYQLMP